MVNFYSRNYLINKIIIQFILRSYRLKYKKIKSKKSYILNHLEILYKKNHLK